MISVLERILLPGGIELDLDGLIVIVGPNSSGKSHLLRDLRAAAMGEHRKFVVAETIRATKPEVEPLLEQLEKAGEITRHLSHEGKQLVRPNTATLGMGRHIDEVELGKVQQLSRGKVATELVGETPQSEYLAYVGRFTVASMSLDRRLSALQSVGMIDFASQAPAGELHALYLNTEAQKALNGEVVSAFGKAIWLDATRGNKLELKLDEKGVIPSAEDRLDFRKMQQYRSIEDEGDGMRAYVAIALAMLVGKRPLYLLDEPEMCLHPPQALRIGRLIGTCASERVGATVVATHSAKVLQGVVDSGRDAVIVRLTRKSESFNATMLSRPDLRELFSRPTSTRDALLDGLFSDVMIAVESDNDRQVYRAVWEALGCDRELDCHFASVGGKGGLPEAARIARSLSVPFAAIADLDLVLEPDLVAKVLRANGTDAAKVEEISTVAHALAGRWAQAGSPTLEQVAVSIAAVSRALSGNTPSQAELERLSTELKKNARLLAPEVKIPRGGLSVLVDPEFAESAAGLLGLLEGEGVFLVPLGELEDWLASSNLTASRSNKAAWARAAEDAILKGAGDSDIRPFIQRLRCYLRRKYGV